MVQTVGSENPPYNTRRAWDMAETVLGTPHPRCRGLPGTCRLLLAQSGQAWVGGAGERLALFLAPPGYRFRPRWPGMVVGCVTSTHPCYLLAMHVLVSSSEEPDVTKQEFSTKSGEERSCGRANLCGFGRRFGNSRRLEKSTSPATYSHRNVVTAACPEFDRVGTRATVEKAGYVS